MGSQTTYQVLLSKEKTYPSRKPFLLSWIWISSSTTRRNADNWGIFGDEHVECVRLQPGGSKMGPASLGVNHHEHILGGSGS